MPLTSTIAVANQETDLETAGITMLQGIKDALLAAGTTQADLTALYNAIDPHELMRSIINNRGGR